MKTIYLSQYHEPLPDCVATIGFFDGVHLGHQYLVRSVVDEAHRSGLSSTVITFDRHPREVLQKDYRPSLLTTLDMRLILLSHLGVDRVVVLEFTPQLAALTAQQFMQQVLAERIHVRHLFMGHDNRFGSDGITSLEHYQSIGRTQGIEVSRWDACTIDGINVSSSVIRSLLTEGEVELAQKCLGRPYAITGTVVHGYQQGRSIGFPTANISLEGSPQLVPAEGVYAVQARLEQTVAMLPGMMNIGHRPTFGGQERSLETHIFDFRSDVYGKQLSIYFHKRLRGEKRFDNVTLLVQQLQEDERQVRQYFNTHNDA